MKHIRSSWDDEELEEDMSIYGEQNRLDMVDDDSISPAEAAFMKGWDDAMDNDEVIE